MELRVLSALLALTVSISPGPSALGNPSPVGGSLTGIFTADDYPPDALDLNQEGSVGVLVRVDPKGKTETEIATFGVPRARCANLPSGLAASGIHPGTGCQRCAGDIDVPTEHSLGDRRR